MAVLRYLNVKLQLLSDDFNNKIKAAQREAKEFEKVVRPSKELLRDVGTVMAATGIAVVGSMTAMARASANYGDELRKASQRTGVSVQDLGRLRFAAEQAGASFTDVSAAMRVFARNADEAARGSKAKAAAFRDLGIEIKDASGKIRPMNDLILDVAERFATMGDGVQKAAMAQELFGRGGTALIPLLNQGRDGLKEMGDMAERLGLVISDDAARASEEFNDTLEQVKLATLGLSTAIGQAILPALTKLAATMRDAVILAKDFAREHEQLAKVTYAAGAAILGAGGLAIGLSSLLSLYTKLRPLVIGVTAAISASTLAWAAAVAGVIYYRNEIMAVARALSAELWKALEFVTGATARFASAVGADGLAGKLREAEFSMGQMWRNLQNANVQMYAAGMVLPQVTKKTKDVTDVTDDFTRSLKNNTAEIDRNAQRLAQLRIDEILDKISFAQRTSSNEFTEWIKSVNDGTAALTRLHSAIAGNPDAFTNIAMGDQEIWRVQADRRTAIFGDALDTMRKDAEINATFIGKALKKPAEEMSKAMSAALGNVTADFADALTDVIFKTRSFSSAMTSLMKTTAKNMLNAMLVGFLSPFTEKLAGLGSKLASAVGGALNIGGGAGQAATAAATSAGSGGTGSAVGSAVSSLAGGGVVGAAVSAIGSLGTIMQLKRIEGTMNAVEYNTRASEHHLYSMIEGLMWPSLPHIQPIREALYVVHNQLDAIYNVLAGRPSATPATGLPVSASPVTIAVTVNNSVSSNSVEAGKGILETIDKAIMTGIGGYRERWTLAFSQGAGLTSSVPVR